MLVLFCVRQDAPLRARPATSQWIRSQLGAGEACRHLGRTWLSEQSLVRAIANWWQYPNRQPHPANAERSNLNFSQTPWVSDGPVARSQSVTNDGCPISARFWQMWDSTAVHRSLSTGNGSLCPWSIYTLYTQGPKFAESHICQNRGMGHPSFITDQAVRN